MPLLSPPTPALPFVAVTPCRLVDTRGNGAPLTGGFLPAATVRTYTLPPPFLLDEAARHGLYVMAGVPWSQHVAFLADRKSRQAVRSRMSFVSSTPNSRRSLGQRICRRSLTTKLWLRFGGER